MSPDSAQLAGYKGDMGRQMAIMAVDPALNVLRYLLHQIVEEAESLRNLERSRNNANRLDNFRCVDAKSSRRFTSEAPNRRGAGFSSSGVAWEFCQSSA